MAEGGIAGQPLRSGFRRSVSQLAIYRSSRTPILCTVPRRGVERENEGFRPFGQPNRRRRLYSGEGECIINPRLYGRPVNVAESQAQIVPRREMEVVAPGNRRAISPHAGGVSNERVGETLAESGISRDRGSDVQKA